MSESREALERMLLSQPFDLTLRERYARRLGDDGLWAEALAQWQLCLQQSGDRATPHIEAARCCRALGDRDGERGHLAQASDCADFDPDDARLPREPAPQGGAASRLRVLAGGRDGEGERAEVVRMVSTGRVRFVDIVGMEPVKKVIRLRIIEPFVKPGLFERFRKRSGGGVLLYGPPGCGKTMMARAIASECNASFTAVGISDILSLWQGESERNLSGIFQLARENIPSVLFFDELDALAFSRSKASSDHTRTLVNEFLAQLDGMSGSNEQVLILAATNMPWDVDDAMKRPGRFDRQVFIPPPDVEARARMYESKLVDVPTAAMDWAGLARRCEHFSGADIDGVIERAKETVLSEILDSAHERVITEADLLEAIEDSQPSTLEWLKTARNLVKFGGAGRAYRDVERYLREARLY